MNDMKEEAQKKRALEARHSKDAAKHKKEQRMLEGRMKRLEADKRQKDVVVVVVDDKCMCSCSY